MAQITARLCRFVSPENRANKRQDFSQRKIIYDGEFYMAKTNKLQSYKMVGSVNRVVLLFDNPLTWPINFVLRVLLPCDRLVFLVNQEMAVTNCLLKFDEVE